MKSFDSISINELTPDVEEGSRDSRFAEDVSRLDIFFSILFLSGLYTALFLYFSDRLFIPYIICGLSAIYFLIRNRNIIDFSYFLPLLYLYIISGAGMVFVPGSYEYFFERFKGLVQLIYSSSIALLFFIHMRKWRPEAVSKLFFGFMLFILIGTALEVYTPFKYLSDEFRHMVFRWGLYESDLRDLYTYGQIRPKLFTSEPSHVAKFYILSLFVWFALSESKKRYFIYLFFISAGLILIRSPIIALSIPLALAVEIFLRNGLNLTDILNRRRPLERGSLAVFIIISVLFLSIALNTILASRVHTMIIGADESFASRIIGPALIAFDTIKEYPFWGTGITGKEAAAEIIFNAYWRIGYKINRVHDANTNFLSLFISYYGVLGGLLFVAGLRYLVKRLEIEKGIFITCTILLFSQTMGAFVGLRTWGYIFIVLLVANHYKPVNE